MSAKPFSPVRLPPVVSTVPPEHTAELERRREERMRELAEAQWQPSVGWLVEQRVTRPVAHLPRRNGAIVEPLRHHAYPRNGSRDFRPRKQEL